MLQLICTVICAIIAIVPAMINRRDGRKDKKEQEKRDQESEARKRDFDEIKSMMNDFKEKFLSYQEINERKQEQIEEKLEENMAQIKALEMSQQILLRVDIFQYYQFIMNRRDENGEQYLTPSDAENIEAIYKCYENSGGNGVGKKYYLTMMALPTRG